MLKEYIYKNMQLRFGVVLLLSTSLSGCFDPKLYSSHITPINPVTPEAAGQAMVIGGLNTYRKGKNQLGFAQAWWAPVPHLVLAAEGGLGKEQRSGTTKGGLFSGRAPTFHDNVGRSQSFGGGVGYFSSSPLGSLSILAGYTADWQWLHYYETDGEERAETSPPKRLDSYSVRYARPWLQSTWSVQGPQEGPMQPFGSLSLRINWQKRTYARTYSDIPGRMPEELNRVVGKRSQFPTLQVGLWIGARYKFLVAQAGPQYTWVPVINDGYYIPGLTGHVSLGLLLGWKRAQTQTRPSAD